MRTAVAGDTAPVATRRPWWRRALKIAGRVVVGLVVLLVLAIAFVHSSWGKSFVRGRVEAKLGDLVNGEAKVGSLDYTFLFGQVELRDLEIRDATGKPAIAINAITVDVDRGSVLAGEPVIDNLVVDGVAVSVVQGADGRTNLTGLFKPSDRKPLDHIRVARFAVSGRANVTKPDGTIVDVRDLAIAGSADARPATHEVAVTLDRIAAKLAIASGDHVRNLDLALADVELGRHGDAIDAEIRRFDLGALAVDAIAAHVRVADGHLAGAQTITIGKARVDSKKLAAILGRELLLDDVTIDASVTGPADKLAIRGRVRTRDTSLALDGTADASVPARPTYTLALVAAGKSEDLVAKARTAIETDLRVDITGSGITPADVDAQVALAIGRTKIGKLAVDDVTAKASAHRGTYRLDDLKAHGLGFSLAATGEIDADKSLRGRLVVGGSPAKAMEVLAAAGIAIPRRVPAIGHVDLAVTASGTRDGALTVELEPTRIAIAGGAVSLAGSARIEGKTVTGASTKIALASLDLDKLAALAGKPAKVHGTLSGAIDLAKTGDSQRADFRYALALREPALDVVATGTADASHAIAKATVTRSRDKAVLATLDARLPLDAKGLAPAGTWHVDIDAARRPLTELAELLPERLRAKLPPGAVELHAKLAGSPSKPTGTIDLTANATAAPLGSTTVAVHASLEPTAAGLAIATKATIARTNGSTAAIRDESPIRVASATSPTAGGPGCRSTDRDGSPRVAPVTTAARLGSLSGSSFERCSNPVRTNSGSTPSTPPTAHIGAAAVVDTGAGDLLARIDATVTTPSLFVGGTLDVAHARQAMVVDASVDIPDRKLASLADVKPILGELGGNIAGTIAIRGPAAKPAIDAKLRWHDYGTASGAPGETTIAVAGSPTALTATIESRGCAPARSSAERCGDTIGHGALAIVADVDRSNPDRIAIRARAHAAETPLRPLLPAAFAGKLAGNDPGRLRWDMTGTFALARGDAGLALAEANVTGSLDVTGGAFAIPKSDRRYHDIGLAIAAEPNRIRLVSLAAHESDVEDRDRQIDVSGTLALDHMKPAKLDLALRAHDWLVFGSPGGPLGPADAPHAAADFDLGVGVDLTQPVLAVDATVNSLAFRSPDRFDRAHQPEQISVGGDVIFIDKTTRVGRLPVAPAAAPAEPHHRRAIENPGSAGARSDAKRRGESIDIRVHIPKPIRLNQTPFDVVATGDLTVKVRDDGIVTRGGLTMQRGTLSLFGRQHELVEGSLTFTDEHPSGWLALTFERKLPDWAMRELAKRPDGARIVFAGSPTKPKTSLAGAANAALAEVMAMHNAGRPVNVARPGLPASATAQAPRGDQLQVLTFLATNLPDLVFLDRMTAWADPYQYAGSYGQIRNVLADRYSRDESTRVRAVVRPPTPGRSQSELHVDRLLFHDDRKEVGVGLRAGDRGGGGLGLFFEWSSDD